MERPDGSGDLVFQRTPTLDSDGDRTATAVGFTNVADVRGAEEAPLVLAGRVDETGMRAALPRQRPSTRRWRSGPR
jgi:hypothetical protein